MTKAEILDLIYLHTDYRDPSFERLSHKAAAHILHTIRKEHGGKVFLKGDLVRWFGNKLNIAKTTSKESEKLELEVDNPTVVSRPFQGEVTLLPQDILTVNNDEFNVEIDLLQPASLESYLPKRK